MICIETATGHDTSLEKERKRLTTLFCDYFVENEPDVCFIVANDDDQAVGYIICAKNYAEYERVFRKEYVPRLKGIVPFHRLSCGVGLLSHRKYAKTHPAHLHIDLLPEAQRQGNGTKLMNCLFARLRELDVPGVFLGVSEKNTGALSFYRHIGFEELNRMFGTVIFGMKL
jgi:ribosomal protein S18 acetylase RimI-like enzyme